MSDNSLTIIRNKVEKIKKSLSPKALFVITSDDKIIYASEPLIQIIKRDPVGLNFIGFFNTNERQSVKEALEKVESGDFVRTMKIDDQSLLVQMTTSREIVEGRVIGLTVITNITVM